LTCKEKEVFNQGGMPLMRMEKSPYSQLRGSKLRFKKRLPDETEGPRRTKA
jgi:hypothetical protein